MPLGKLQASLSVRCCSAHLIRKVSQARYPESQPLPLLLQKVLETSSGKAVSPKQACIAFGQLKMLSAICTIFEETDEGVRPSPEDLFLLASV